MACLQLGEFALGIRQRGFQAGDPFPHRGELIRQVPWPARFDDVRRAQNRQSGGGVQIVIRQTVIRRGAHHSDLQA